MPRPQNLWVEIDQNGALALKNTEFYARQALRIVTFESGSPPLCVFLNRFGEPLPPSHRPRKNGAMRRRRWEGRPLLLSLS